MNEVASCGGGVDSAEICDRTAGQAPRSRRTSLSLSIARLSTDRLIDNIHVSIGACATSASADSQQYTSLFHP